MYTYTTHVLRKKETFVLNRDEDSIVDAEGAPINPKDHRMAAIRELSEAVCTPSPATTTQFTAPQASVSNAPRETLWDILHLRVAGKWLWLTIDYTERPHLSHQLPNVTASVPQLRSPALRRLASPFPSIASPPTT